MIIAVVNQKGGVGKTTTVVNLAQAISHQGKKVLLVDLDPQGNASSGLGITDRSKGIYELLSEQINHQDSLKMINENFYLIPSNQNLAGANIELVNLPERERFLTKTLASLPIKFDYVFLDNSPSLGLLTVNSLVAANKVLIPVQAEYFALEGLGQLLETVNLVKQNLQPNLDVLGAIITMYDDKLGLARDVWEELYRHFPYKIFRTVIPRDVKLAEAPSFSKSIFDYAPKSKSAKAYQRLAREFLHYHHPNSPNISEHHE